MMMGAVSCEARPPERRMALLGIRATGAVYHPSIALRVSENL